MIGVFDSGHGGLTILRGLVAALPDREFLYYGDHAHAPYGERTSAEIVALTRNAVEFLFRRGCKLVVLACNTAAAVALRTLQQEWLPPHYPDHRILGVLVPTVEAVTGMPWLSSGIPSSAAPARTIAVFATRRTVASNAYPEEIRKRAPEITVVQHACAGLVSLIEQNAPRAVLAAAIRDHVAGLQETLGGTEPDAVLLGCTHYPLVADIFAAALPAGLEILSQPEVVGRSLRDYLSRHPDIDHPGRGTLRFVTSGIAADAAQFASLFFGRDVIFTHIKG
jgi:glutamate racemase